MSDSLLLGLGPVLAAWLFALGLALGSFLNVVIARVPYGESIVRPRSKCPKCGRQLTWKENIPLFSWAIQRGKCRGCGAPISWRYPAVELLTGLLFLACLARFDWTYPLLPALVLVILLVPLTFIDLEHWILPYELTLPGLVLGVALAIPMGLDAVISSALGAAVGFFVFWGMEFVGRWIFKKEALGAGDKYLLALLGAFLGARALLGVVFLSSLQGALVGSLLLLVRGRAGPAPTPETPADALAPSPTPEIPPDVPPLAPSPEGHPAPEPAVASGTPTAAPPASPAGTGEEDDWVPGPTNIPFGPWLAIAGLEVMLLGDWLSTLLPYPMGGLLFGISG